jgi:hypothetical protein
MAKPTPKISKITFQQTDHKLFKKYVIKKDGVILQITRRFKNGEGSEHEVKRCWCGLKYKGFKLKTTDRVDLNCPVCGHTTVCN